MQSGNLAIFSEMQQPIDAKLFQGSTRSQTQYEGTFQEEVEKVLRGDLSCAMEIAKRIDSMVDIPPFAVCSPDMSSCICAIAVEARKKDSVMVSGLVASGTGSDTGTLKKTLERVLESRRIEKLSPPNPSNVPSALAVMGTLQGLPDLEEN